MKKSEQVEKNASSCYAYSREHLRDELEKLDTLLHFQVLRFRNLNPGRKAGTFAGLYIAEEEVDSVIGRAPGSYEDSDLEAQRKQVKTIQEQIFERVKGSLSKNIYLPFYRLSRIFQLGPFEMDIILVCLAVELDLKYEKLYAYLQDDVTKKSPSVNLIMKLLCYTGEEKIDARTRFFADSPLFKFQLLTFIGSDTHRPLINRFVKLADRIVNFILEQDVMDAEIFSIAKMTFPKKDWSGVLMEKGDERKQQMSRMGEKLLRESETGRVVFYLKGPYGIGKKLTAEAFCYRLGLPLIIVDINELLDSGVQPDLEKLVKKIFIEALLRPAAVYLEHFDRLFSENSREIHHQHVIINTLKEFSFITFTAGEKDWNPSLHLNEHPFIEVRFPLPSFQLRKQLWNIFLNDYSLHSAGLNIDEIANKFQFTGGQIRDAFNEAGSIAMMKGSYEKEGITMSELYDACNSQSNRNLSKMARKVIPHYTWSDIVLPVDKLLQLKEMCNYVKYRQLVYDEWGFDNKISSGTGLNVLFSGPSGTGKTMTAEIVAHELNLNFFKIDLSCVVSKYIGETEKNLSAIFKEAETANAILFFDEADALFGKRSEVKDAHDRYANIEINYLLQKMEEHEGFVILATNFRRNIDEAFTRRMHFALDFPFPDREYRLDIWHKIFPEETPKSSDIDYEFLAKKFKISGGNIKNIALNSAFLAADNSGKVDMHHIVRAAKREFQKMGKLCSQAEFGKYYPFITSEARENR